MYVTNEYRKRRAIILGAMVALYILVTLLVGQAAKAQDVSVATVCRDVDYGYGSFVIRIPAEWQNPDLASWWVLADGFGAYDDVTPNVYRADALTKVDVYGEGNPQWAQDLKVGDVLVGSGDYSFVGVYNQSTPECDANDFPVSTEVPTPEPTCSAVAYNSANGQAYCYVPQANGVVPIPPAP